jgi:hypothetical protein
MRTTIVLTVALAASTIVIAIPVRRDAGALTRGTRAYGAAGRGAVRRLDDTRSGRGQDDDRPYDQPSRPARRRRALRRSSASEAFEISSQRKMSLFGYSEWTDQVEKLSGLGQKLKRLGMMAH